jgi:hypothetical protein
VVGGPKGAYDDISSTIYLDARFDSGYRGVPHEIVSHELGHVVGFYVFYIDWQGDWTTYLEARKLTGHPKLDSEYKWNIHEMFAEDFRLLIGPPPSWDDWPVHFNSEIPHPDDVPGLEEFMMECVTT